MNKTIETLKKERDDAITAFRVVEIQKVNAEQECDQLHRELEKAVLKIASLEKELNM